MAGKALELGGPIRLADYLSLRLLARLVHPDVVNQALTQHGKHSRRQRDLPAHALANCVMALSLYRGVNTEEVLRPLATQQTPGAFYQGLRLDEPRASCHAKAMSRSISGGTGDRRL